MDSFIEELRAKHPESCAISRIVNVADEVEVAAWINETAKVMLPTAATACCSSSVIADVGSN
jgi:hypothetical protein